MSAISSELAVGTAYAAFCVGYMPESKALENLCFQEGITQDQFATFCHQVYELCNQTEIRREFPIVAELNEAGSPNAEPAIRSLIQKFPYFSLAHAEL